VVDVWREYAVGIDGGPAVRDLEEAHGTSWRQHEPERRYFSRRRVFYNAVEEIADAQQIPQVEAAAVLEAERKKMRKTLDGVVKYIKTRGAGGVYNDHVNNN
jgi:hypothetical protein